nr:MAG TPA_asm: hypothetical protein [Caudoviricetes sp.]
MLRLLVTPIDKRVTHDTIGVTRDNSSLNLPIYSRGYYSSRVN